MRGCQELQGWRWGGREAGWLSKGDMRDPGGDGMSYILTASVSASWLWCRAIVLQDTIIGGDWLKGTKSLCDFLPLTKHGIYTQIYNYLKVKTLNF